MTEEITEEISKAPSIRGNLKLIKELTKRISESEIFIDRTLKELCEKVGLCQEALLRSDDRIDNLSLPQTKPVFNTKLENIEKCIAKMAHYNGGNSPRICTEFGIEEYKVKLKDMSRFSNG